MCMFLQVTGRYPMCRTRNCTESECIIYRTRKVTPPTIAGCLIRPSPTCGTCKLLLSYPPMEALTDDPPPVLVVSTMFLSLLRAETSAVSHIACDHVVPTRHRHSRLWPRAPLGGTTSRACVGGRCQESSRAQKPDLVWYMCSILVASSF